MNPTSPDLAHLLLRASESEIGLKVFTNNPQLLRNKLYAERRKVPEFSNLTFIQPPEGADTRLWIIKKERRRG